MRGIILAGGTGSRLGPLTKSINKHVLPVHDVPMIYHPLRVLRNNDIDDVTIVSSPSGIGQLAKLLGSGSDHKCRITYRVQDQPGGIAQALLSAYRGPMDMQTIVVILGDNVFVPSMLIPNENQARCFLYKVNDREQLKSFGVPSFDENTCEINGVVEKPQEPASDYAVTGLYAFGAGVWRTLREMKPSARGEVEITDVLDFYAKCGILRHTVVTGFWGDAGTVEGMAECAAAYKEWSKSK